MYKYFLEIVSDINYYIKYIRLQIITVKEKNLAIFSAIPLLKEAKVLGNWDMKLKHKQIVAF